MRISDWSSDVCSSDLVQHLENARVAGHDLAIEDAVQQQARLVRHLQRLAGVAHGAAQRARAQRNAFGVEGRASGQYAASLAQQVPRQRGPGYLAGGDLAQRTKARLEGTECVSPRSIPMTPQYEHKKHCNGQ